MSGHQNLVPYPPAGLVLAIQYWEGDEAQAMRLARLLADIEPEAREDGTVLALCRREDLELPSALAEETLFHCSTKFKVMRLRARRPGKGHPEGCNALAASVLDQLAIAWRAGNLGAPSVFLMEADGCPLSADWINRLRAEHQDALLRGKRVTGAYTEGTVPIRIPHINGSLIAHLSMWFDRPSLHQTPTSEAWDLFHAIAIMQEAQPTGLMRNLYGARDWSDSALAALARESAWLANTKDDSALRWAEEHLVAGAEEDRVLVMAGGGRPDGTVAWREHLAAWKRDQERSPTSTAPEDCAFSYQVIAELLRHRPMTWRPAKSTETP